MRANKGGNARVPHCHFEAFLKTLMVCAEGKGVVSSVCHREAQGRVAWIKRDLFADGSRMGDQPYALPEDPRPRSEGANVGRPQRAHSSRR